MNGLRELQHDFSGFVWGEKKECGQQIVQNGFEPEQRLAIYRNNTLIGLTEALRDLYPVIEKLVGERFFSRLCRDYICRYPPVTGCLLTFGDRFPEFLADFHGASSLPYLPDTARLEWLRHEVYFESDQIGIDAGSLTDVPPERYGELRFRLHPAVRWLNSSYPVLRIWQFNQKESREEGRIDLEPSGGCRLLIFRFGREIKMAPLDPNEYRFMTSLHAGRSLSQAASEILQGTLDFDLAAVLRFALNRSLFSEYIM